jgi:hypothetical protein
MAPVKIVWGGDRSLVIQDLHSGGFDGDVYVKPAWMSPEMAKYTGTVMAIDPSGKGQDETAYAIIRSLHGTLYLVDVGGFTDGFGEATLHALATRAIRFGVTHIIDEENYGGGMFRALLKPVMIRVAQDARLDPNDPNPNARPPAFDEEWNGWSSTQKELRILDTLEPIVKSHRLVVDRRVIEADQKVQEEKQRYSFVYQFTRVTREKGCLPNEDRLEAVSMGCNYFTEKMKIDKDRALANYKEAALDAELRRFKEHAIMLGQRSRPLISNRPLRSRSPLTR